MGNACKRHAHRCLRMDRFLCKKRERTETVTDVPSSEPNCYKKRLLIPTIRKLAQNRYAFSFEYKKEGWTVRSEYIHSTGKAFAKSITNFNDANAKDCTLNEKIGDKAQGVYGLVIAPLAQLPKNSRIDIKARYDMYQPNGKSNMQRTQYEAGLNFHIGKRITILTEYALSQRQDTRQA